MNESFLTMFKNERLTRHSKELKQSQALIKLMTSFDENYFKEFSIKLSGPGAS